MACNEKDQHIISLSTARVFRIWDIHTLTSLQVGPNFDQSAIHAVRAAKLSHNFYLYFDLFVIIVLIVIYSKYEIFIIIQGREVTSAELYEE